MPIDMLLMFILFCAFPDKERVLSCTLEVSGSSIGPETS
jgi:hypothetical protein